MSFPPIQDGHGSGHQSNHLTVTSWVEKCGAPTEIHGAWNREPTWGPVVGCTVVPWINSWNSPDLSADISNISVQEARFGDMSTWSSKIMNKIINANNEAFGFFACKVFKVVVFGWKGGTNVTFHWFPMSFAAFATGLITRSRIPKKCNQRVDT